MSWFKNIINEIKGSEDLSDIKTSTFFRDLLTGNILTKKFLRKQYGLIAMIALLTFIYIDNRYYCETQLADEIKLKKQLQDIKYESLTISAELMQLSRQSNVEKMIRDRGVDIEATTTPPIVINDSLAGKHE